MRKKSLISIAFLLNICVNYGFFFNSSLVVGAGAVKSSATYTGISHYTMPQNVTYEVTVTFRLDSLTASSKDFQFKYSLFDSSETSEFEPPIQVSTIQTDTVTGNFGAKTDSVDSFDNNFHEFDQPGFDINDDSVIITLKYRITMSEITFDTTIPDSDIGSSIPAEYTNLYINPADSLYFETSDPELISLSNTLSQGLTNPVAKAKAIYDWIGTNIEYEVQTSEEGAAWCYDNTKGDCSEYSDLMITLLRIQGIPARKCTGLIISSTSDLGAASPDYYPRLGDTWNFYSNITKTSSAANAAKQTSNILLHAWLEYYVDDIGWIPCDPTWGDSGYNYFNRMDFLHLTGNIGAWFEYPGYLSKISEFSSLPSPIYEESALFKYTTTVKIEVVGLNLSMVDPMMSTYIAIGIISVICLVIYVIFKKAGKKKKRYQETSSADSYTYTY